METRRKILIGVAWPYATGELHLGHVAGAYLAPDVYARFQRMRGHDVLMVSGSDTHGTPITVKAEERGVTPMEMVNEYHGYFIDAFEKLGVTFDLFTHTETECHWKVVQKMFLRHQQRGYIFKDKQKQLFDAQAKRFLPDRYVEGTCPHCGSSDARGDQCDACGKTYEAVELKNPRSKISGSTQLEVRETEHFFLDLAKANDALSAWINDGHKSHWRTHVLNFSRTQIDMRELRGRCITRDLDWGVNIPLDGYDDKRLYVWYDAVIGYLSAAVEWAKIIGREDAWKDYWVPGASADHCDARSIYFLGKDNISFHTIIWPAMLLAHGDLRLPYDVPANFYLNMAGRKFSKSRGNVIAIRSALDRYQVDAWRYALVAMSPETADSDFTWEDFVDRVNGELVANWGNLANRVLGFACKRFEGKVPQPGTMDATAQELLKEVRGGFETVGDLYEGVKLKSALDEIRRLSQRVNQYLSDKAPWTAIKTDPQAAATSIFVALQCIEWLKTMWAPILPVSSQKIHAILGHDGELFGRQFTETQNDGRGTHKILRYDHRAAVGRWEAVEIRPGHPLREPQAPFAKLDEKVPEIEAGPAS